jgi:PAS domain S-box-containing protein
MEKHLQILIIEDSEDDTEILLRELARNNYEIEFERVESAEAMRSALENKQWDLILCDYSLPHFDAPHALEVLKASGIDIPFIILSGTIGEESAIAALKAGAHDFLIKGNFPRLGPAIERELREAQIRREHKQATQTLREKERLLSEAQSIGHIGSWSYDLKADVLQFSDEMYHLLDVSPKEFKHSHLGLLEMLYSSDRSKVEKWMEDMQTGKQSRELEFRILKKNGELRYMHCRGATMFGNEGTAERFVGTMQDVTESKLAEIQIRQQLDRLLALRKIDQAITSTFQLNSILNTVLIQTQEQLQVDAASVLLFNQDAQLLEFAAGRGFKSSTIRKSHLPLGEGHAGRAITERRVVQVPDLNEKPLQRLMPEEGFVSYFGVPLIAKGKVKGVLEVFHRSFLQPYPEWLDFLETLAGQAAIAVDNASLLENLQQSNLDLAMAYDATIEGWSHALDLRDRETEGHTKRVTEMTIELAYAMNINSDQMTHIKRGGLLHDIGKMGVPDKILLKEGPLTAAEWKVMRQHPQLALEMLSPIAYLRQALDIPYCHHERWDGTGYPRGLKAEQIPLAARVFAVADVWDALTSNRPYRQSWSEEKTLQHIRARKGTHFDPQVVEVFVKIMSDKLKTNAPE